MTSLWQAPAVVIALTWLVLPAATLGDAARQEALRRSVIAASVGSFTIVDWPQAAAAPAPVVEPRPSVTQPMPPRPPPALAAEPTRDESWWRARLAAARDRLARDQALAEAVQTRINALRSDAAARDDPAQQAWLRQELGRTIALLERMRGDIAADRQAIVDIQEEARRQDVPPAWVR